MNNFMRKIIASAIFVSGLSAPTLSQAATWSVHGHLIETWLGIDITVWAWYHGGSNVATAADAFLANGGVNTFNFDMSEIMVGDDVNQDSYTIDSGSITFSTTDIGGGLLDIAVEDYSFIANIVSYGLDGVATFGNSITGSLMTGGSTTVATASLAEGFFLSGLDSIVWFHGENGVEAELNMDLGGTLEASAVPLPAGVWLFGSGLIGLIGVARRKKSAKEEK